MLMRPHDGGVDDQVFEVRIFNQRIEKTLPNALLCPSAEALEYAVPGAELTGQIAPRCSGANQPKHSVHEQTIVLAVPPFVTFLTRNERLDTPPLPVRKCALSIRPARVGLSSLPYRSPRGQVDSIWPASSC